MKFDLFSLFDHLRKFMVLVFFIFVTKLLGLHKYTLIYFRYLFSFMLYIRSSEIQFVIEVMKIHLKLEIFSFICFICTTYVYLSLMQSDYKMYSDVRYIFLILIGKYLRDVWCIIDFRHFFNRINMVRTNIKYVARH